MGISRIKVTSKNTGIASMNPAIATAYSTNSIGNRMYKWFCNYLSSPGIAHELSQNHPKPIGSPMLAIILPKPEAIVSMDVIKPNPQDTPI